MAPLLKDCIKCMAMMNSVIPRAPRCSVSASAQMRPSVSFGNLAFSNIFLAVSPIASQRISSRAHSGGTYLAVLRSLRQTSRTVQHTAPPYQVSRAARGWRRSSGG